MTQPDGASLKRTPLHGAYVRLGARVVKTPFYPPKVKT